MYVSASVGMREKWFLLSAKNGERDVETSQGIGPRDAKRKCLWGTEGEVISMTLGCSGRPPA